jgi:hypothetical protein
MPSAHLNGTVADKESAIRVDLRSSKAGIMKLAAMHGVGVGTVQRIK